MNERRLLHYTTDPLEGVRSVEQGSPGCRYDKPTGLWLSVEGEMDWREWCEEEQFGNVADQLCYEVTLTPDAKILRLETPAALLRFTDRFGCDPYMGPIAGRTMMSTMGIDWQAVTEGYAGIIIAPYHWSLRLDDRTRWYYGWDCASGCIWDATAIERITPTTPEKQPCLSTVNSDAATPAETPET